MAVFDDSAFDNHERVLFCSDDATGLRAIIAIHSTALGPAAGGCRQWTYANDAEALHDVLRLSHGMSYKNAMAGLSFGGGKAVIMQPREFVASDALYEKFGECVDSLGGNYITAEDVGMSVSIMETIARSTRFVSGLPPKEGAAGGDPSPKTAFGIFKGIEAAVAFKLHKDSVDGLTVAVQGVGNVGRHLCSYLSEAGANLIVADINEEKVRQVCHHYSATAVSLEDILEVGADVLAPCALGAVLTADSIPRLKVSIVAGGANNQLETASDGQLINDAGILYAPDYVINAGGIINVACEYYGGSDDDEVMRQVAEIGPRLTRIFEEAAATSKATNEVADAHARAIIENA